MLRGLSIAGCVVLSLSALPVVADGTKELRTADEQARVAAFVVPVPGSLIERAEQPSGDAVSPALAAATAPVTVPIPPGLAVGLVGLASAAVARRRYLKRH